MEFPKLAGVFENLGLDLAQRKIRQGWLAVWMVAVIHLVGAGLLTFGKDGFYELALFFTPVNLCLTAWVAFYFQEVKTVGFYKFLAVGFGLGTAIELVGVQTGWPFGEYTYGPVLGPKWMGTPLVIGVNWLLVTYGVGCFLQEIKVPIWTKVVVGTGILVFMDYFMEPVAMKHNFWNWASGSIPNANYAGWAGTAFVLLSLFYYLPFPKTNPVASRIWIVQFWFFVVQNLF